MSYTSIDRLIPRRKTAFVALAALFALTTPALADPAKETKSICLRASELDHTKVLNDHQVLFYMKDRKIWLNTLKGRCATLPSQDGFVMESNFSEFCANAQTIRVVRTGESCQLGEFTPYKKVVTR